MGRGWLGPALLLCAGVPGAQAAVGPAPEDPAKLTLDELIERLPKAGSEWIRNGTNWTLEPTAAEMKRRIEQGAELTNDQWKTVLFSTGALRVRSRWPVSEPFAVSMKEIGWLWGVVVRIEPRDAGLTGAEAGWLARSSCGTYLAQVERSWLYQPIGLLPLGRHELVFDLTLERGSSRRLRQMEVDIPAGICSRGELRLEVEVVATQEEAVPARSSPELAASVARSLGLAFRDWAWERAAILMVDPDVRDASLARLGLSLELELRHGDEIVETMHLVPSTYDPLLSSNSVHAMAGQPFSFGVMDSLPPVLEHDSSARTAWSLRVRGTSEQVLSLWEADAYWSGELELGLDELIAREREMAPAGRGPLCSMPSPR